ncbi:MAG: hypothetical protein DWP98_08110 [Bacteroidetes bacterium]|nr:MAG: hypothetical protein DWP98_08110 [Bacteroidota bacterium]MBL1145253.1 hypothetical protein [Bacteroidota bacterium]NOG58049.1 hypothetical protein [Bacteroidota bacterium]
MNFIYPEFLYALGFLVIPIIIHLFNFRRYKTVRFSQVRFLKELKQQTKSTSRLKHLLVLISRCLLFASLVIAFAQPYLLDNEMKPMGKKGVIIYLDNSFSMASESEKGILFELGKNKVLEIIAAYGADEKFNLITNDIDQNSYKWLKKERIIEKLQEAELSPIFRSLSEVNLIQQELFQAESLIPELYYISDFQKNSSDFKNINDTSALNLVYLNSIEHKNLSLDSLSSSKPFHLEQSNEIIEAFITNYSEENFNNVPFNLYLNNSLKSPSNTDIQAKEKKSIFFNFMSDKVKVQQGKVVIKDYPITFDDTLYYSFEIQQKIQVFHIFDQEANNGIRHIYELDSLFDYSAYSQTKVDYGILKQQDLIVLDELKSISSGLEQELKKHIEKGGSLVIFLTKDLDLNNYNLFFQNIGIDNLVKSVSEETKLTSINKNADLYKSVFEEIPKEIDLPFINNYWTISNSNTIIREKLLGLTNGLPYLLKYKYKQANVYLNLSSLNTETSNFTSHAIFVPTMYNMALYSAENNKLYHTIGQKSIPINIGYTNESPLKIKRGNFEFIPKQRNSGGIIYFDLDNNKLSPGYYKLFIGDSLKQSIAVNYNRKESDISTFTPKDIERIAEEQGLKPVFIDATSSNLTFNIEEQTKGVKIWKYFIVLALIFIGLEILFLRILK